MQGLSEKASFKNAFVLLCGSPEIECFLDDLQVGNIQGIYFLQDEALPHSGRDTVTYLIKLFRKNRIRTNRQINGHHTPLI